MIIIGVDPGLRGAIAICNGGTSIEIHDMPTFALARNGKNKSEIDVIGLGHIFNKYDPDAIYVERVGSMPGQGVSSVFAFGKAVGCILGAAGANFWKIHEVTPQVWKKSFNLGATKDASRAMATKLFPQQAELFNLVKHDGRAEAALIAHYGFKREKFPS